MAEEKLQVEITAESAKPEQELEILNSQDNELEEEAGLGQKLKIMLFDFQENHPWFLFGLISLVVFLIIISILIPLFATLFGGTEQSEDTNQATNTEQQVDTAPIGTAPLLATTAFQKSLNFADRADYLRLMSGTIYDLEFSLANDQLLEQELLTLKNADLLLSYDIVTALQQSGSSRSIDFEKYLGQIKTAYQIVSSNDATLHETLVSLQQSRTQAQNNSKSLKGQLNQALLQGSDAQISELLAEYLASQEEAGTLNSRIQLISEISKASKPTFQKLQARLAGLQANREALIAGIQVIDIDQSGLNLIRQGVAADYLN